MTIGNVQNIFAQGTKFAGIKPIKAASSETSSGGGASAGSSKPSGNTIGVNTNIGVGESMFTAGQAGKPGGVARTLAFA